ncbi:MAG: tetratricopeptide repeat protein [Nitrospirota bacterium]|jgi:tetratricopeptide (TPR) repeat protein
MPWETKELYERASDLFEKNNYIEAEGILKEVARQKPRYADVLNKLGVIAHLDGRLEEACEYFERALNVNPGYTEAALNLTITLNEMGATDRAYEVFMTLVKDAPRQNGYRDCYAAGKLANEHYRLGNIYYSMGSFDEAIEEYRKALARRPGLTDIHTRLGMALREKGLFDDAITELTKAKQANPVYGQARVQLGLTYYLKGHMGLAFAEWEQAAGQDPELKEARTFLHILRRGG